MNIVSKILQLPPVIYVKIDTDEYCFHFEIFINGDGDLRMAYPIQYTDCWENVFDGNKLQGFLYLVEGIETDVELSDAVDELLIFLKKYNLNKKD